MSKKTRIVADKKDPTVGISAADSQNLSSRVEALEELVRDHLHEKNQWNAELRNWIGKTIYVDLLTSKTVMGVLLWVDRYTLGVKDTSLRIIHKAAITVITLSDQDAVPMAIITFNG